MKKLKVITIPDRFVYFIDTYYPMEKEQVMDFYFIYFIPEIVAMSSKINPLNLGKNSIISLLYHTYLIYKRDLEENEERDCVKHFVWEYPNNKDAMRMQRAVIKSLDLTLGEIINFNSFTGKRGIVYEAVI